MNRLFTFGSLGIAGLFGAGLLTAQLPALADTGADDAGGAGIVRVDDRGGRGGDDPAGHDVGDDHGRHGGGHARAARGGDDPAGHDVGDDHGRHGGGHARAARGGDDPAGHDAGDDHGRHSGPGGGGESGHSGRG